MSPTVAAAVAFDDRGTCEQATELFCFSFGMVSLGSQGFDDGTALYIHPSYCRRVKLTRTHPLIGMNQ